MPNPTPNLSEKPLDDWPDDALAYAALTVKRLKVGGAFCLGIDSLSSVQKRALNHLCRRRIIEVIPTDEHVHIRRGRR